MSTDSPRSSTSTPKEETHPSSPEDIRPLPKDGHRQSECKQAEENNCQFDWYIVKYALKITTTQVLEQMRKTGPKTRGTRGVRDISSERFTKETPKNIKKSKNASNTKWEGSKDTLCLYCLDAYSRSTSREMWIQCTKSKLRVHEKCTDGSPSFICSYRQSDGSEYSV